MQNPASTEDPQVEESGSYYISAPSDPWPYALKHGESFALFDDRGDIVQGSGRADGLYFRDTRVLSRWRLLLNGRRPVLLSSTLRDNNAALIVDLANREVRIGDHIVQQGETQHVVRTIFLWDSACHERIAVFNYGQRPMRHTLRLEYRSDFADLFQVRGHQTSRRGTTRTRVTSPTQVELAYTASDGVRQATTIQFDPPPYHISEHAMEWEIEVQPGERCTLFSRIDPSEKSSDRAHPSGVTFLSAMRQARTALNRGARRATAIESSNEIFNEIIRRSIADLYMLITETEDGSYPYAGVPWYSTPFGRDGIITAMEMLWVDPHVARGVLFFLARTQAQERDPMADAEPGKILHEMRHGELARTGEVPFLRYYGSVDATPLFVLLAGQYYERTGDSETLTRLWPNIEAALRWIDGPADLDGDGFIEYQSQRADGLVNQGWKDSADAVFHADGQLAEGPIALVEVQGYVYAAKKAIAAVARALGRHADCARLLAEAEALRLRFEKTFWSDKLGTYVLALDGKKRLCEVRSSNTGHVLLTGIASAERAVRVADDLVSQSFFCGWGVRTVASGQARFNPMSYHNGSVWPHDNALIALGLAQYGLTHSVEAIFTGLYRAATFMNLRRLPELFCGFRRRPGRGPTYYPVACSPQAWAAAAPLALLQASLGLRFDIRNRAIVLHHPRLPDFLDEMQLRNLRLQDSSVDLLLRRHGHDVAINVVRRDGDVAVDIRA
ncbi:MAG TPA: glycogen debranching N-terminal domain-containing protein [Burkholderiales bacterium]|nr:glycogen debranching N-terminal domain-containing protein [Burkholderiales bacterium]